MSWEFVEDSEVVRDVQGRLCCVGTSLKSPNTLIAP